MDYVSWITTCWDILYLMFDILSFVFDVILELYLDNLNSKWAHTTIAKYSSCCKWRWCSVETWALHTQSAPWWWLCLTWLWCKVSAREWFLSPVPHQPQPPPLSWSDKQWVNRNMVMLQWELQETVKCWTGWPQRAQWPGHLLIAFPISTINRSQQNIRKIYRRVPVYLSIYLTIVTLPTHGRHRYTEVPSLVRATAAH